MLLLLAACTTTDPCAPPIPVGEDEGVLIARIQASAAAMESGVWVSAVTDGSGVVGAEARPDGDCAALVLPPDTWSVMASARVEATDQCGHDWGEVEVVAGETTEATFTVSLDDCSHDTGAR